MDFARIYSTPPSAATIKTLHLVDDILGSAEFLTNPLVTKPSAGCQLEAIRSERISLTPSQGN
jgi:hypothetical protein